MNLREQIIDEAEAYARAGQALPLDLIASLMAEGIDHTLYSNVPAPAEDSDDAHNVD